MTIRDCLGTTSFDDTLVMGYYGGGNFGDELLLEVLMNLWRETGAKRVVVAYSDPANYARYHRDYGFEVVDSRRRSGLLRAFWRQRRLVIGGGGLWGLDVNANILILSLLLFIGRHVLGKEVYLLGVGYYSSTSRLGHVAAWLAGKAATLVVARDTETADRFRRITPRVSLADDIAFSADDVMLTAFAPEAEQLAGSLNLTDQMIFITLRHFQPQYRTRYEELIQQLIAKHPDTAFVLALLSPPGFYPEGAALIEHLRQAHPNVQVLNCDGNPLAVLAFFYQHRHRFRFITPQFHAIVVAMSQGIPFLPIAYDNKVVELIRQRTTLTPLPLRELTAEDLERFITEDRA
jgi:polysaccharide pyruvyl transferase WcaK-like protein